MWMIHTMVSQFSYFKQTDPHPLPYAFHYSFARFNSHHTLFHSDRQSETLDSLNWTKSLRVLLLISDKIVIRIG
jgi:hypothetical protein